MSNEDRRLKGIRVLITGVGIKPINHVFTDISTGNPSHTPICVKRAKDNKANIGTACAIECAKEGAIVHIVARTEEKLRIIQDWINYLTGDFPVEYSATDLNDKEALKEMINAIPTDMPLYWIQSVGVGGGTVAVKDDNPYLLIEDIPPELVEAELTVLKNTITLMQLLLPRFRTQKETRICIISSMSAIRSVISASMHMAAKGAISRFTNAAMLELDKDKIFITDVRPGAVDTGMYDSAIVQKTVAKMAANYGYDWKKHDLKLIPPSAVGKMVVSVLTSEAHITSVNMVARGQWPHEGS